MSAGAVVYRMFDADGVLLYIGYSTSFGDRLDQHRTKRAWWHEVATIKVEHFPTREVAYFAEQRAIAEERPPHNRPWYGNEDELAFLQRLDAS